MPDRIGRYEILDTLGEGAMGTVYKARDPKFSRIIALKAVHSVEELPEKERAEFFERFCREAHAAGNLPHPNIVTIYDADKDSQRDVSYITMEYVEGRSLEDLLAENGSLPADEALEIIIQVAEGLSFAHKREIVHRDIKPANILLDANGKVKITDFGIAKVSSSTLTTSGQFLGTPCYMSPEQVFGDEIDGRSDLFSLSIVLYQLVTGELCFPGNNITTIAYKIVNTDPPPPTHINFRLADGFDSLLDRGMAKKPAERFQTADEMVAELKRLRKVIVPEFAPLAQPQQSGGSSGQRILVADAVLPPATPKTVNSRKSSPPVRIRKKIRKKRLVQPALSRVNVSTVLLGVALAVIALLILNVTYPLLVANRNGPRITKPRVSKPELVKKYDLALLAEDSSPSEWSMNPAVENASLEFPKEDEPTGQNAVAGDEFLNDREGKHSRSAGESSQALQEAPEMERGPLVSEKVQTGTVEARDTADSISVDSLERLDSDRDSMEFQGAQHTGMLNLAIRHPFESGKLLVFADNQLVYEGSLGQTSGDETNFKKKMKALGRKLKLARQQADGIRMPVGSYPIEVEVVRPDGSVLPRAGLAADFEADQERCLSIVCSRNKSKKLQMKWDCEK